MPEDNAAGNQSWDWLVNGLQLGRVRQTIRSFPLDDTLVPPPLTEVEEWPSKEIAASENAEAIEIDTETNSSEVVHLQETAPAVLSTSRPLNDGSYCPGYVLPLILAALESCTGDPNQSTNRADTGMEDLTRMAQRLCEKGALSLALASLCSKCPAIRKVAVSVISFFMWAVDSKEARDISSWRERPQLALLLHSVHRALVVRRAILISREENSDVKPPPESPVWAIPMFPGFSAIFLARAAFVLVRPGESTFAPLNKFFLSIDKDHGAFRDMNRLPAFITLLCSSSDEPADQARNERIWALKLFKAGFLDEFCFKMVSTCHAPELLLTTIFNYRMRTVHSGHKQQDDECVLLVQAVEAMLRHGGRQATHQLIGRMGLLSWLRSVLESPVVDQILPTAASRTAFLKLVSTAVRRAVQYEADCKSRDEETEHDNGGDSSSSSDTDEEDEESARVALQSVASLPLEICSLARPTLEFCLASFGDTDTSGGSRSQTNETGTSITACSLDTLMALQSAFLSPSIDRQESKRADGIELGAALKYLSKISCISTTGNNVSVAIDALTGLPVALPPHSAQIVEDEDATTFCCRILAHAAADSGEKSWIVQVLTRLSLIIESANVGNGSELLQTLLESRAACFEWPETRELWFELLRKLLESSTASDLSANVEMPDATQENDGNTDYKHAETVELLLKIKLPTSVTTKLN